MTISGASAALRNASQKVVFVRWASISTQASAGRRCRAWGVLRMRRRDTESSGLSRSTQVGQPVAHLPALVEPHAADHPVRHGRMKTSSTRLWAFVR